MCQDGPKIYIENQYPTRKDYYKAPASQVKLYIKNWTLGCACALCKHKDSCGVGPLVKEVQMSGCVMGDQMRDGEMLRWCWSRVRWSVGGWQPRHQVCGYEGCKLDTISTSRVENSDGSKNFYFCQCHCQYE